MVVLTKASHRQTRNLEPHRMVETRLRVTATVTPVTMAILKITDMPIVPQLVEATIWQTIDQEAAM